MMVTDTDYVNNTNSDKLSELSNYKGKLLMQIDFLVGDFELILDKIIYSIEEIDKEYEYKLNSAHNEIDKQKEYVDQQAYQEYQKTKQDVVNPDRGTFRLSEVPNLIFFGQGRNQGN